MGKVSSPQLMMIFPPPTAFRYHFAGTSVAKELIAYLLATKRDGKLANKSGTG